MQQKKRILSVTVKRMVDESPDTSWLGEYSQRKTSEFSIDREHSLDCVVNSPNEVGQQWIERIRKQVVNDCSVWSPEEVLDATYDTLDECSDALYECDCDGRGDMGRGEYRYFNPSFNYVDKNGHALPENTPEEVRKYVRQDYERMEAGNRGDWCMLGVAAEAEVWNPVSQVVQRIHSGGLWGIESDSGDYIAEEEKNQLAELKSELLAYGFSKRAIATAFKDVKHKDA